MAVVALAGCLVAPSIAQAQQASITPKQQAGIQGDIARHFGSAPASPGPRAKYLSGSIRTRAVRRAMRKVANWELKQAQPYFGQNWTWGTLYAGFMAAADSLHDARYRDAMEQMGEGFHWQLKSKVPIADDQCLGQTYTELYLKDRKPIEIQATRESLDRLQAGAEAHIPAKQARIPWWWCDSLFMAPPVWSRMYAATQDAKYLTYLNEHWWQTSRTLYDPHWHLFYRDITYLHATGPNGKPVFWSRGEGWVMAGLVRTLEYMPQDYPTRGKFETQLRQMAAEVATLQDGKIGLWHSNLLDAAAYPRPETSGSALMTYALAWGVNHGVLSRAKYEPVIRRAWRGLVKQIYADGRLGNIQQTGAAPAYYRRSSSFNYGVGAFLLAGSQVMKLSH
ncbi:MAG: glycoside hydrolase family 88/105 protein [Acidobacteriaceae bacterium]